MIILAVRTFMYIQPLKGIGKIISMVKIEGTSKENENIGVKIAMHIAASNPLAIDKMVLKKD